METYESFRAPDGFFYIIYKIVNKLDGKFYIGQHQTKNLDDGYMGSGLRIQRAIEKYGKESFDKQLLHFFTSFDEMNAKEIELVTEELISRDDCYNIATGGMANGYLSQLGNDRLSCLYKDDDFMLRRSNKLKCSRNTEDRKAFYQSNEFRTKMSECNARSHLRKKFSQETRSKMSLAHKGQGIGTSNTQYGTRWVYNIDLRVSKKIKQNMLDEHLATGWVRGYKKF